MSVNFFFPFFCGWIQTLRTEPWPIARAQSALSGGWGVGVGEGQKRDNDSFPFRRLVGVATP